MVSTKKHGIAKPASSGNTTSPNPGLDRFLISAILVFGFWGNTVKRRIGMRRWLVLTWAALGMVMAASAAYQAGFARVDTTPPVGIPIPGYFHKRVADGLLDPICAECVAVSDGEHTALIYSVDNLHLSNPFLKTAFSAITEATGIPRDLIYIHSTHTHTGPTVWASPAFTEEEQRLVRDYAAQLVKQLAEAGRAAVADLAPTKIAVAKTVCTGISAIRRYRMKDGSVRTNPGVTNPNVEGPLGTPDETLQVIRFKRTGAPDIAIVNFGTHPDTVGGTKYSADWPGVVRKTFEAGVGDGVKCLFLNAAQGDVNHIIRNPPPGRAALARADIHFHMGRAVAGVAMGVWDICEDIPDGPVRGAVTSVRMPSNMPTADEIKWVELFDAGKKDEIPLGSMEIMTLTSPGSRVRTLRNGPDHFDILVSSIAIGDAIAFAGLPCEPFVDIGRDIKAQSPFRTTIISCLTNGAEGYIPSTKAHQEGGYEGLSSRFAAPTGDLLVAAQVEQLKKLNGKDESK